MTGPGGTPPWLSALTRCGAFMAAGLRLLGYSMISPWTLAPPYGVGDAGLAAPSRRSRPAAAAPRDGPPPGHPERVRPDLPPSLVEKQLWRDLGEV